MSRKTARESAFRYTYEYLITGVRGGISYEQYKLAKDMTADDLAYYEKVADGIIDNFDLLSGLISDNAEGYRLERIYKIDLAILLVAAYELKFCADIPASVSINEAVELAKTYSTDKSFSFINGVLAKIAS